MGKLLIDSKAALKVRRSSSKYTQGKCYYTLSFWLDLMVRPKILVSIPVSLLRSLSVPSDEAELFSFADVVKNVNDVQFTISELQEAAADVDGMITSWGSPKITPEVLERAKKLKIIGHAAGSVKPYVCDEAFERGVVVVSAAPEIARSVAEYALCQMINSLRDIPDYIGSMKSVGAEQQAKRERLEKSKDLAGKKVGLIGSGSVARRLIRLLKPFDVEIRIYDPYLSEDDAMSLGIIKTSLNDVLSESDIISLHAASTAETHHMMGEKELGLVRDGTILINSARGALIDEGALISELRKGRFRAVLDTAGEETGGIPANSELRRLENVYLTPGLAGPSGERQRMLFSSIVGDFRLFFSGKEPRNQVNAEALRRLA